MGARHYGTDLLDTVAGSIQGGRSTSSYALLVPDDDSEIQLSSPASRCLQRTRLLQPHRPVLFPQHILVVSKMTLFMSTDTFTEECPTDRGRQ